MLQDPAFIPSRFGPVNCETLAAEMSFIATLEHALSEFAQNPAEWLTFGSTLILGLVTVYFAWRTRQLERKQVLQLHREIDREITDAEAEIERARMLLYLWFENWRPGASPLQTLKIYSLARANYTRPDVVKTVRILSFYLPEEEKRAGEAIIRMHAGLEALDFAISLRSTTPDSELTQHIERVEETFGEVRGALDASRDRIEVFKSTLRKT